MSRDVRVGTSPNRALVSLLARHPRAVLLAVVLVVGLATQGAVVAAEPSAVDPMASGQTVVGP